MVELWAPALAGFFISLLAILALRPIAVAVDLIDRPGGRKTHQGNVPIVGGIAMFIGTVLGVGLLAHTPQWQASFLAACALLVTVGLLDDRFELSPWARLPAQIAAGLILMTAVGDDVTTLGRPFGSDEVTLIGWPAQVFTVAATVAAINAFNMLDGMDGLAGAAAAIGFAALAYLASSSGLNNSAALGLVLAGSVAGFLIFSLPLKFNRSLRCFMGDAGSTLLGFGVAWLAVRVSQAQTSKIAPVTILWIVALPLYELFWSTIRRVTRGVSPFKADTDHFHHLLLQAGLNVRGAFTVFVGLAVLLASFGLLAHAIGLPDRYSFVLLVLAGAGVVRLMYRADVLVRFFPSRRGIVTPDIPTQSEQVKLLPPEWRG